MTTRRHLLAFALTLAATASERAAGTVTVASTSRNSPARPVSASLSVRVPPVTRTTSGVRVGPGGVVSSRKFRITSSRLVAFFSHTTSSSGRSSVNSPGSERSRARENSDLPDVTFATRASTRPCASVRVTSRSSTGENHPSDAPPTSSLPLRSVAAARASRFRSAVFATIVGANHTRSRRSATRPRRTFGQRRRRDFAAG